MRSSLPGARGGSNTDSRAPRTTGSGGRAGTTCVGDGRTAGCGRPRPPNASSSDGDLTVEVGEHLAVPDRLPGGAGQRSPRRRGRGPRRPGRPRASARTGARCGRSRTGRGSHTPAMRTGNTGGPNSWRPAPNDENGRPVISSTSRARADPAGVAGFDARRGGGIDALQLGVGGREAGGRRGTGEQRVAHRPVLRRDGRAGRSPPARRARCRRRAGRGDRGARCRRSRRGPRAGTAPPTTRRRARPRRPGGAGPRRARPPVGLAVPMSRPR